MEVVGGPIWLYFLLRLIELAILITMTILWLREMQRSLEACNPVSRQLEPSLVWLTFIPLFGLVWQFICSKRVGDSLSREYYRRQWSNEEECPGNEQGIITAVTVCLVTILRVFFWSQIHPGLFFIGTVAIGFCMFRHFDRLKAFRERLEKEPEYFGHNPFFHQQPVYPQQPIYTQPIYPQWMQQAPNYQQNQYPPPNQYSPMPQYPPPPQHQYPPGYAPVPVFQPPPAPNFPPPPVDPLYEDENNRWRPKDIPPQS